MMLNKMICRFIFPHVWTSKITGGLWYYCERCGEVRGFHTASDKGKL